MSVHNDRAKFSMAKEFKIRFGKFKGQTLNQAAEADDGLLYLDWMAGLDTLHNDLRDALTCFLSYQPVAHDLDNAITHRKATRR